MYGIDIFDNIKMSLNWTMIYYGIRNNLLRIDIAQDFVYRKMEQGEELLEEELELSWHLSNKGDVLELIKKILDIQGGLEKSTKNVADRIRIAIIVYLRNNEKDVEKLLEQINSVYADFGYPVDMERFISYMPADDNYNNLHYTVEENRERLLSKLDCFIDEQIKKYDLKKL